MGTISAGVGLISGINTAQLIDSLLAIEGRGRDLLQGQVGSLQAQQTAFLDINARILGLVTSSGAFRSNKIFQSSIATSSDTDTLTAKASTGAAPGSYTFVVKQLVSSSQQLSKGFIDEKVTPLGLSTLKFEVGDAGISTDTDLSRLNAANGVDRGKIKITTDAGSATVDLSDVTTLNEVVERINAASGIGTVTASVVGDHLQVVTTEDTLKIEDDGTDTTATDLGIAQDPGTGKIIGTDINTVGLASTLDSLNDGLGVLITNFATDIKITARDGTAIEVDFGRTDQAITDAGLLSNFNNASGVTLSPDSATTDLTVVGSDGTTYNINLTGVTTVAELKTRITDETSSELGITIDSDNTLKITDLTGPHTQALTVSGPSAADLGFDSVTASPNEEIISNTIPFSVAGAPAQTLEDIINRINNTATNTGLVLASIDASGLGIQLTDTSGSTSQNFKVESTGANAHAAAQLGLTADVASSTIAGTRLISSLNSVFVDTLNGGSGVSGTTLTITDRAANPAVTISNVDSYHSLADLITAFNAQAVVDGSGVRLAVDTNGTRLKVTDSSGGSGNLVVAGTSASSLGIETTGVGADSYVGTNLQKQYVHESTKLADLNYGRGVGVGKFKITDGLGNSATIDIGGSEKTVQDVIAEINSQASGTNGLRILASINANGDGILISEALEVGDNPFTTMKITNENGTAARDLNLLQSATSIGDAIDGTFEQSITVSTTDTMDDIVKAINASGVPVAASVVNTGSGPTPFRLNLTSQITGTAGELFVDTGSFDLGITKISTGQDAKVFFGSADPADAFLITQSSNTLAGIATGLTIDLVKANTTPVTVTVDRDKPAIVEGVTRFTTSFNDVIGTIDRYDFFNVDTENKGVLLGNSTTSRIRAKLLNTVQQRVDGVSTQFQYLSSVGIRIGSDGQLNFNQSTFDAAYASDSLAVENLFAAFEQATSATTEIAPGITVPATTTGTATTRGFGDIFKDIADDLTNSIDGTLTTVGNNIGTRIDNLEDRIEEFNERLEFRRFRLQAQFNAMERALAQLQGQSGSLSSLAGSVTLQQSFGT